MSVTIAANAVALLLTFLMPLGVALATKARLDAKWKSLITLILSAVIVLVRRSQVDGGAAVISTQVAFDWAVTTGVAVLSYLGFWQPVLNVNEKALPEQGLG